MQRRDFLKLGGASALLGLAPATVLALPGGSSLGLTTFAGERRLVVGASDLALSAFGRGAELVLADGSRRPLTTGADNASPLRRIIAASLDNEQHIVLLDAGLKRLERYAADGGFLGTAALPSGLGWSALARDGHGRLWAADSAKPGLWVQDARGWQRLALRQGLNPGELNGPSALAFDRDGRLHVLNSGNRRIDVYDQRSMHQGSYGDPDQQPRALTVTEHDEVLVLDSAGAWLHGYASGRRILRSDLGTTTPWRALAYRPEQGLYLSV